MLETDRLRLVVPAEAHVDAIFAMYSDEETTRFIPHARSATRTAAWLKVAGQVGHWQLRGFGFYVVLDRVTGEVVGNAGLLFPADHPTIEIGWLIDRHHWRKGYALEATRAILAHALGPLGADWVTAQIAPDNAASLALAAKLGMKVVLTSAEATILHARRDPSVG